MELRRKELIEMVMDGVALTDTGDLTLPVVLSAGARNQLNVEFSWTAA